MINKSEVLLMPKENSDLNNITRMDKKLNAPGIASSLGLDVLRRCNSLPIFNSNNMSWDWKKKTTNSARTTFITRDRQSIYLADTSTLNFDPSNTETETKSLQELQSEVNALIEFRNIVIETFPDLKTKMMSFRSIASSQRNQSKTKKIKIRRKLHPSVIPQENSVINGTEAIDEAVPSFVSRSRSNSNCCRKEPKSGEGSGSTVQDSGFSTETISSKDGYSATATSGGLQGTNISDRLLRDSDDELLNLLDVIFRKTLRFRQKFPSMPHFECDKNETYVSSVCVPNILNSNSLHPKVLRFNTNYPLKHNLLRLNKERDKLLLKVAELESEIIKNRIKISKMETKLEFFRAGNTNLEEQLKAALNQNQERNFELLQHKCDSASRKHVRPPPTVAVKRQREVCVKRQYSKFVTQNLTGGTGQLSSKRISENNPGENDKSQQSTTFHRITPEFNINSENLENTNNIKGMLPSRIKSNPDFVSKSDIQSLGKLDGILSSPKCLCKVREIDSNKIAAILLETNPLELQRHLLTLTVETQAKRSHSDQHGPNSIPLVLKKTSSKLLLQNDNKSYYRNDCLLEQQTNGQQLQYEIIEPAKGENSFDSIRSHDSKIQTECEKNFQPAKRLKPSKIPLFGSKTNHSSKAIHKSLSLSTGSIYLNNSRLNQQDSLTLKARGSSPSVAADYKAVSALLKTNRDLETDRFLQLDSSLAKSNKSSKTKEYIQTLNKTGSTTPFIIQNKHSNHLITLPTRSDTEKKVNTMVDSTERNVNRKHTKGKTDTEKKIGYITQPDVQLLIGGISKNSYRSSITNSSNSNSIVEDEKFTDDNIGRVRNLRSTFLGWLKI